MEKLRGAYEALHEAAQELDDSETSCGECGLRHKTNWAEARVRIELLAAAGKVDRALDSIEAMTAAKAPRKETGT